MVLIERIVIGLLSIEGARIRRGKRALAAENAVYRKIALKRRIASMPGTILKQDSSTVSTFFSARLSLGCPLYWGVLSVEWSGYDARHSAIIIELLDCNRHGLRPMLMDRQRVCDRVAARLRAPSPSARPPTPSS
jgi:hypothetical protein